MLFLISLIDKEQMIWRKAMSQSYHLLGDPEWIAIVRQAEKGWSSHGVLNHQFYNSSSEV